jgi:lysyl-tRNA synthetase class II
VNVAGRLVAIRRMGKASFVNLKDEYGTIQAWIGINVIGEHDYKFSNLRIWAISSALKAP